VHADRGQLEQVLLNLTLNGRDAMTSGGVLTVAVRDVSLPAEGIGGDAAELPPGRYAQIDVRDTGTGMDGNILARVFEPFFTTKTPGQGTGLGLSVVYGIVRQSGGRIVAASAPAQGSVFSIYLPSVARATAAPSSPAPVPSGGSETIVLVDDEPVVLMVAGRTLRDAGYEVLEAANGRLALELLEQLRKSGRTVSLVVTDVIMPELDGRGLGERIAARQAAVPILYVSGHTTEGAIREGLPGRVTSFLNKPFDPDALLRAVRALLDRAVSQRTAPRS
jgi:CheY-like chemotaxis protein